jgi:UPF0755 protein
MTQSRRARPRTRAARSPASSPPGRWYGRWLFGLVGLAIGAVASGGAALSVWSYWSHTDKVGKRLLLVIGEPDDPATIGKQLADAGLVDSARLMSLYLATLGRFGAVQPGPHLLPTNASPRTLSQCLARYVRRPDVELTIIEGFDHVRVANRLEQAGVCPAKSFVEVVRRRDLLDRLGIRGRDGEGYLFPASYRLNVDADPEQVFERFVAETRNRLRKMASKIGNRPFEDLSASRGWGEFEILTLASIIEKEAQVDEERPIIASVFFNRLDDESFRPRRMLQSDPTAGYGCLVLGESIPSCLDYQQRIVPAILRDASNPYNTYRHPGLPPGPIANPSEASVLAVLAPAKTNYLFFVAIGNGRHRFSSSFEEHDSRVRGVTQ